MTLNSFLCKYFGKKDDIDVTIADVATPIISTIVIGVAVMFCISIVGLLLAVLFGVLPEELSAPCNAWACTKPQLLYGVYFFVYFFGVYVLGTIAGISGIVFIIYRIGQIKIAHCKRKDGE